MSNGKKIGLLLVLFCMYVGVLFFSSFVLMKVYNWFIPAITGFNEITYWMAFGVDTFFSMLIYSTAQEIKEIHQEVVEIDSVGTVVAKPFGLLLGYAIFLGVGALVHLGV